MIIVPLSMPLISLPLILSGGVSSVPSSKRSRMVWPSMVTAAKIEIPLPASGDVGRFATLRETFANWRAVLNGNPRLALALILLYGVSSSSSLEYLVSPWKEDDP